MGLDMKTDLDLETEGRSRFSFEVSLLFTISSIIIKIIPLIVQIEHILVGCSSISPFTTPWYIVIVIDLYSSKYSDCFYLLKWLYEDLLFVKPVSSTSPFFLTFFSLVSAPLKFYIQIPWWHLLLSHLDWRWMITITRFLKDVTVPPHRYIPYWPSKDRVLWPLGENSQVLCYQALHNKWLHIFHLVANKSHITAWEQSSLTTLCKEVFAAAALLYHCIYFLQNTSGESGSHLF